MTSQRPIPPGRELLKKGNATAQHVYQQSRIMADVVGRHAKALPEAMNPRAPLESLTKAGRGLMGTPQNLAMDAASYMLDAAQRSFLFWDTMREAGNNFVAHEQAGCPPVLIFDFETVVDGRKLKRPVNYALVRITPPDDMPPSNDALRPFLIIDPRAGHGAGIGGFKSDSQVGVALRRGHPVYFVIFFRDPEPGQTILDITAAEAVFLNHVTDAHPKAPKPVVIGNCQGGWAVMMLGASMPNQLGALVLNGAPLSYWAGEKGKNPMRYLGGLAGGGWPAALMADMGNGRFDGANLVANFEALSPANTWFRKYFDLYQNVDEGAERFLEFERWWGGYFLMNRDEIRWIVENLFIGNRFSSGRISAGDGQNFNMREVKAPIIVFASAGDNITPPGQALRWIADVYRDEREIKSLGQTIVYLLHEDIGHLGIFVSGKVAKKEHSEIATTLEMIESVAPGLYEMHISNYQEGAETGEWQVELVERSIAHVREISGEAENEAFPAVAQISELNQHLYDVLLAPVIRQFSTEMGAEARRHMNPMRWRRYALSDMNPWMGPVSSLAGLARENRKPVSADNPFLAFEKAFADSVEYGLNAMRDARDAWVEIAFHGVYGSLNASGVTGEDFDTEAHAARDSVTSDAPQRAEAEANLAQGGYAEAVIRMMILLADARGAVRRSRLARSNQLLTTEAPFAQMTAADRMAVIRDQTMIATLFPEEAIKTLTVLLPDAASRRKALKAVETVAGPDQELGDNARARLQRLREVLAVRPQRAA
jgi:pimeloyl-ACP methyl ester carboxylesterase